jgi:hypothetical protein
MFAHSLRQLQAVTFRRSAQRVCIQVRVPRGGGRVSVAEQLSNYRQPKASASTDARMGMTQVMNPNAIELSSACNCLLWQQIVDATQHRQMAGGAVHTEDQVNACTAPVLVAQNDLFEAPPIGEKLEIPPTGELKLLLSH